MSAEDLTVAAVAVPILDATANVEPLVAFELGPDGATFDEPLLLAVELPGSVAGPVAAVHVSSDGASEFIPLDLARYDTASDRTTYVAEITHFSTFFVGSVPPDQQAKARLLPEVPRERYAVGESFTVRISVPRGGKLSMDWVRDPDNARGEPSEHASSIDGADWSVQPSWFVQGRDLQTDFDFRLLPFSMFEPDGPSTAPPPLDPEQISSDQVNVDGAISAVTFEETFTCVEAGTFHISFWSLTYRPFHMRQLLPDSRIVEGRDRSFGRSDSVEVSGECVLPEGATTPAPGTALQTPGVASPTTGVAPAGSPLAPGEDAVPTVVLPPDIVIATPASGPGTGDLPGFIRVYAYAGVFYYADTLVVTPAHEPFCSYEHLHGSPIDAVVRDGFTLPPLAEMYGECGFGPTNALFWIPEPE